MKPNGLSGCHPAALCGNALNQFDFLSLEEFGVNAFSENILSFGLEKTTPTSRKIQLSFRSKIRHTPKCNKGYPKTETAFGVKAGQFWTRDAGSQADGESTEDG